MRFALDHIVILVYDLAVAMADYTALGFVVTPGGDHTDGATHNALVVFDDGVYLEIIAFKCEMPDHQWWRFVAAGEGFVDFALMPEAIGTAVANARQRGLEMRGPIPGGRLRLDNQKIRWHLGVPALPGTPFLCADVTPRALRVPEGDIRRHPNGVTGVAQVKVAVRDREASAVVYQQLLGIEPNILPSGSQFGLGDATLLLVDPAVDEAAAAYLERRGEGVFALTLRSQHAQGWLDLQSAHGARMIIEL